MGLHRAFGEGELTADDFDGRATGQQLQYLLLALGKRDPGCAGGHVVDTLGRTGQRPQAVGIVEQVAGNVDTARQHELDRRNQGIGGHGFGNKTRGSHLQHLHDTALVLGSRQHEDLQVGIFFHQGFEQRGSHRARQTQVEQHQLRVGISLEQQQRTVGIVRGLHFDVGVDIDEQGAQCVGNQLVIIYQQNLHGVPENILCSSGRGNSVLGEGYSRPEWLEPTAPFWVIVPPPAGRLRLRPPRPIGALQSLTLQRSPGQ